MRESIFQNKTSRRKKLGTERITRKLQGKVLNIERTGEIIEKNGEKWEKCIFTVEITGFSKRTPEEIIPRKFRCKRLKVVRYCCFDWHYRTNVTKTLNSDETQVVLNDKNE